MHPLFNATQAGVTVFFVLSGFILAWTARENESAWTFWQRRAARILPAHWVAMTVCLSIALVMGQRSELWRAVPAWFLVQSWVPDMDWFYAGNSVAWSLSCEALFYLFFPFLFPIIARMGAVSRTNLMIAGTVLAGALQLGTYQIVGPAETAVDGTFAHWLIYTLPLARLPEFLAGICVGIALRRAEFPQIPLSLSLGVLAVAVYGAGSLTTSVAGNWLLILPIAAVLVGLAQRDARGCKSWLHSGPVQYAGRVSFCVYLTQLMFLGIVSRALGETIVANVVSIVLGLGFAVALHHAVEVPCAKLFRPRKRIVVAVAPAA
ncbi:acyltransferase [Kineosporia babensis]